MQIHHSSFSTPNVMAIFRRDPLTGTSIAGGYKKLQFLTSISLYRVLSTVRPSRVVNRVPPDRGKLVILIAAVCVLQHSNEAHLTVLLWRLLPRDVVRWIYSLVTMEYYDGLTQRYSRVLFRAALSDLAKYSIRKSMESSIVIIPYLAACHFWSRGCRLVLNLYCYIPNFINIG